MKQQYTGKLRCITCGDTESFEFNDDKSYIKCVKCGREYLSYLQMIFFFFHH